MFKFRKKWFRVHLSGVIIISLGFSMAIIAIAMIISMRELSTYALSSAEKRISNETARLFFKNTQRKAEEYSNIFDKACSFVNFVSKQIIININSENNYDFDKNKIQTYCNKFEKHTANGSLINSAEPNILTFYTGKEKYLPKNLQKSFYSLSLLPPLLEKICLENPSYFSSWMWFCNSNNITVCSKNNSYRKILSTDNGYKDFLHQIKVISGSDNNVNKIKLTDKYKNILGISVLTALYKHYNDRGELVFVVGIDFNMDDLGNSIINNKVPIFEYGKQKECYNVNSFDFIVNPGSGQIILSSYGAKNIHKAFSLSNLAGIQVLLPFL